MAEALEAGLLQDADDASSHLTTSLGTCRLFASCTIASSRRPTSLIPEAQKKPVHLDVGRLLLAEFDADAPDDRLFAIVNHLNIGADLIDTPSNGSPLARLNLAAGRKGEDVGCLPGGAGLLRDRASRSSTNPRGGPNTS